MYAESAPEKVLLFEFSLNKCANLVITLSLTYVDANMEMSHKTSGFIYALLWSSFVMWKHIECLAEHVKLARTTDTMQSERW